MFCISVQAISAAEPDQPSSWAEDEINAAIENGLVPESLQQHYRENITRTQYVLLALKVYDLLEKGEVLSGDHPFTDIVDHACEEEIARAFHAGIIKGDGKGNFQPDQYITREEIASLVVNLLKQIDPGKDLTVQGPCEYADRDEISEWARDYIDICYKNRILTGVGDNRMAPKGNATIEQSIALIYRIVKTEGLLEKNSYEPLNLSDGNMEMEEPDAVVINNFVKTYGEDTYGILVELSQNPDIAFIGMRDTSVTLLVNEMNTLNLDDSDNTVNLFAMIRDVNDTLFISAYKQLLSNFNTDQTALSLLDEYLTKMQTNEPLNHTEDINENCTLTIESHQEDLELIYSIRYTRIK